ncbi:MAG TPA: hypothetical protein DEP66_07540, partial [Acidimicrobiaceae bacterium]|nr:hypothetical protein [Acidimicrobiaceae bacterium]
MGAWSLVASALSNVGPALGEAGPDGHLLALGWLARVTVAALMLTGRVSVTAAAVAVSVAAFPVVMAGERLVLRLGRRGEEDGAGGPADRAGRSAD